MRNLGFFVVGLMVVFLAVRPARAESTADFDGGGGYIGDGGGGIIADFDAGPNRDDAYTSPNDGGVGNNDGGASNDASPAAPDAGMSGAVDVEDDDDDDGCSVGRHGRAPAASLGLAALAGLAFIRRRRRS